MAQCLQGTDLPILPMQRKLWTILQGPLHVAVTKSIFHAAFQTRVKSIRERSSPAVLLTLAAGKKKRIEKDVPLSSQTWNQI